MAGFFELTLRILPLYAGMFIGYMAGKFLHVKRPDIATLLFYIISPMVVFRGVAGANLILSVIMLPVMVFVICSIITLVVYWGSAMLFRDNSRNVLAFSSGSSSVGFFGLPVAIAIFNPEVVAIYMVCYIGITMYENTLGFYIMAKGVYSLRACVVKCIKSTSTHAFVLGLIFNYMHLSIPNYLDDFMLEARSTFMLLGTIFIGICLSENKRFSVDWIFVCTTIVTKYMIWPAIVLALVFLDRTHLHLYSEDIYKAIILLAIVPMSGTGVIYASILNYQSDKIATMLLINTTIGVLYVPLVISVLF